MKGARYAQWRGLLCQGDEGLLRERHARAQGDDGRVQGAEHKDKVDLREMLIGVGYDVEPVNAPKPQAS